MHKPFAERLVLACKTKKNAVCVGLDPRVDSLPESLMPAERSPHAIAIAFESFCRSIIDVVAPLVPIVKPQVAFFEQLGAAGMIALENTIRYAVQRELLVIADAKRNDIGSTAEAYASAFLGRDGASGFGSDALTVSPYLGDDSLQPFAERCQATNSGIFVLVKTSNPGSGFIQDLKIEDTSISERIASWVEEKSTSLRGEYRFGPIGAVVGATYPQQLAALRQRMPSAWLLIPGYGAQGGGAKDVIDAFHADGLGAVINNSRGIIFAYRDKRYSSRSDWLEAVDASTRDMIEALRSETACKRL